MTALPLIVGNDLDAPLAWRSGRPISRRQYLADVAALAERLPAHGSMLSLTGDRYRFAVGLGAAMLRGHTSLLPPNHTDDMMRRLRELYADIYCVVDPGAAPNGLPAVEHLSTHQQGSAPSAPPVAGESDRSAHAAPSSDADVPQIDADLIAARVLTSGSTGAPLPHAKPWALLVASAQAEAARLAESMRRASLEGVALVATVPAQHMYGFESTVLIALQGGAAFDAERPFYPADIAAALAR
ncbi:MAG: CoA ligase, partial [Caldimonas sp.]